MTVCLYILPQVTDGSPPRYIASDSRQSVTHPKLYHALTALPLAAGCRSSVLSFRRKTHALSGCDQVADLTLKNNLFICFLKVAFRGCFVSLSTYTFSLLVFAECEKSMLHIHLMINVFYCSHTIGKHTHTLHTSSKIWSFSYPSLTVLFFYIYF